MDEQTIKVTELKANMFDNLVKTYLGVEDNEAMVDMLLNQISTYIDLLHPYET